MQECKKLIVSTKMCQFQPKCATNYQKQKMPEFVSPIKLEFNNLWNLEKQLVNGEICGATNVFNDHGDLFNQLDIGSAWQTYGSRRILYLPIVVFEKEAGLYRDIQTIKFLCATFLISCCSV